MAARGRSVEIVPSLRYSPNFQFLRPGYSTLLRIIPALVLVAATVGSFAQTLHFDFVYDDYGQIVDTRQFDSWKSVPTFFTGHVWAFKTLATGGLLPFPRTGCVPNAGAS